MKGEKIRSRNLHSFSLDKNNDDKYWEGEEMMLSKNVSRHTTTLAWVSRTYSTYKDLFIILSSAWTIMLFTQTDLIGKEWSFNSDFWRKNIYSWTWWEKQVGEWKWGLQILSDSINFDSYGMYDSVNKWMIKLNSTLSNEASLK